MGGLKGGSSAGGERCSERPLSLCDIADIYIYRDMVYIYIFTYDVCVYVDVCVHVDVDVDVDVDVCVCVCVCVFVCVCVCLHIYIYICCRDNMIEDRGILLDT